MRMTLVAIVTSVLVCDVWHRHLLPAVGLECLAAVAVVLAVAGRRLRSAPMFASLALGLATAVVAIDRLPCQRWETMLPVHSRIEGVVERVTALGSTAANLEVWGSVDMRHSPPTRLLRIRITVTGRNVSVPLPRPGERIVVMGTVRSPEAQKLSGSFVERSYALTRGVTWFAEARQTMVAIVDDAGTFDEWLQRHRAWLNDHVRITYPDDVGPIVAGLISGEKTDMTVHDREAFVRAGTAHVLSVSGLHVGMVAGICVVLFTWCGSACRLLLVSLCVWTFVVFTGGNPPAVRAGIVVLIAMVGTTIERPAQPLRLLTVAVLAMWVYDPLVIYSASLHLSVGACLGLILVTPRVKSWLEQMLWSDKAIVRSLVRSISVSAGASTGVLFPAAWQLGSISFLSIITNVIVVPMFSAAMMLAAAASAMHTVSADGAQAIANVVVLCVRLGVFVTHAMARCEPAMPGHVVAVAVLIIAGTLWVIATTTGRHAMMRLACVVLAVWLAMGLPKQERPPSQVLRRYGMAITIRRYPRFTTVFLEGRNQFYRDVSLVAWLESEPVMLIVSERGRSASHIVDALERRRRIVRTAYLADRWNAR